jgi:DNA-binding response OmpR family regulator
VSLVTVRRRDVATLLIGLVRSGASVVVETHTILIVEDARVVRRVTNRILTEEGYRVLEAGDAEEALEIVRMPMASIDLLLLDVVLPDMDGIRLYMEISARRAGIPVLFMSAYPAEVLASSGQGNLTAPFLGKPFTRDELITKVGEAIERRRIPRNLTEGEVPLSEKREADNQVERGEGGLQPPSAYPFHYWAEACADLMPAVGTTVMGQVISNLAVITTRR